MREHHLSLTDLLNDEVTRAVLQADGVPVDNFRANLLAAADRIARGRARRSGPPAQGWLFPLKALTGDRSLECCCGA